MKPSKYAAKLENYQPEARDEFLDEFIDQGCDVDSLIMQCNSFMSEVLATVRRRITSQEMGQNSSLS